MGWPTGIALALLDYGGVRFKEPLRVVQAPGFCRAWLKTAEGESPMAQYEVTVSEIDFDFSTNINELPFEEQSKLVSYVLGRRWILAVEAEEKLTGPLCQQISNETGCLVRDVKFTAQKVA